MKDEPKEPGEIQGENLDALRHTMAHILANVIVSSATIEAMARSAAGNVNNMLTTEHFEGNNAMKQALKRASEAIDISDGIRNSILESKPITDIREAERRAERMFSDDISKIINEITSKLIASMPDSIADLFYNELLDGVTRAIGEEQERLNKFYESEQWAELRAAFPDMTEGDGAAILFSGLADQITEYLPELKAKIAEYEEETGHKLTFSELTELEAEEGKIPEPLLSKFIQEIRNISAEANSRKLRTKAKAGSTDLATINRLAIITAMDYINALNTNARGNAYMQHMQMDGLKFNNGKLYFSDERAREVSEMELQDLQTKAEIENINLPFLQFYYSVIFQKWEKAINDKYTGSGDGKINPITKFYLPELAEARGLSKNVGADSVEAIKKDIASFHNIVGVLKHKNYKEPSYYPVLLFTEYDAATNTISIQSPYLLHVVKEVFSLSVRRTKDGKPRLRNDGTPQRIAVNSYLVHPEIVKEKNKAAVQNVFLLVQSIESRGGKRGELNEFSISANTLIERNPLLKQQLTKKNPAQTLKRCFVKTWELLETETDLKEKYINIKLPDPKNPADIPTLKGLSNHVIKITHYGKSNSKKPD